MWNFNSGKKKILDQSAELLESLDNNKELLGHIKVEHNIHLLVVNSFENPVVYRNVQQDGMNRKKLLPGTGEIDISLATFIGDLDFDGYNEIVLGTYGKVFLI